MTEHTANCHMTEEDVLKLLLEKSEEPNSMLNNQEFQILQKIIRNYEVKLIRGFRIAE